MTDPFGIDLVDIPVRHLVMNTTQGSLDVMKCALDKSIPSEGDEAKIASTNRWRHGAQMAVKQRKQMTAADKIKEQAMKEMAGEDVCYFCKKPGHWKQDCPDWKLNVWAATSVQAGGPRRRRSFAHPLLLAVGARRVRRGRADRS